MKCPTCGGSVNGHIDLMLASIEKDLARMPEFYDDPAIIAYPYRDHFLTEATGMNGLAWALCRFDSYAHNNDVIGFLEMLRDKLIEMKGEDE